MNGLKVNPSGLMMNVDVRLAFDRRSVPLTNHSLHKSLRLSDKQNENVYLR
jgi:hypothetical protein